MYYVGVDIAKNSHVASIMDNDGVVHLEALKFENNHTGFSKFIDSISIFPKEKLLIGLESTAHYGEVFTQFIFNLGFRVAIVNPLQTSAIRKAGIRKTKNDKIDSLVISKSLILNGWTLLEERDITTIALKGLAKARRNLISQRTRAKIQLVAYVDQLFPELESFLKGNLHIKTVYELLLKYPTAK
ncbi:IS110 family transposase [uncultured Ilyobacter sp.]|uniref:IS110 family transposase n=1 Tax=uncultured Ilyobacter sp. TaxID=544433 RepID=UPI002AA65238|nr:IS110 family transposase [uncultured Ilyobacter sp.]